MSATPLPRSSFYCFHKNTDTENSSFTIFSPRNFFDLVLSAVLREVVFLTDKNIC